MERRFPCICCGYLQFDKPPGSDEICKICFYQDDFVDIAFPTKPGGPNKVSLIEAQANFTAFGASEWRLKDHTRKPRPDDRRDDNWRPIDTTRDAEWLARVDEMNRSQDATWEYPSDTTALYYWRSTFWLKSA